MAARAPARAPRPHNVANDEQHLVPGREGLRNLTIDHTRQQRWTKATYLRWLRALDLDLPRSTATKVLHKILFRLRDEIIARSSENTKAPDPLPTHGPMDVSSSSHDISGDGNNSSHHFLFNSPVAAPSAAPPGGAQRVQIPGAQGLGVLGVDIPSQALQPNFPVAPASSSSSSRPAPRMPMQSQLQPGTPQQHATHAQAMPAPFSAPFVHPQAPTGSSALQALLPPQLQVQASLGQHHQVPQQAAPGATPAGIPANSNVTPSQMPGTGDMAMSPVPGALNAAALQNLVLGQHPLTQSLFGHASTNLHGTSALLGQYFAAQGVANVPGQLAAAQPAAMLQQLHHLQVLNEQRRLEAQRSTLISNLLQQLGNTSNFAGAPGGPSQIPGSLSQQHSNTINPASFLSGVLAQGPTSSSSSAVPGQGPTSSSSLAVSGQAPTPLSSLAVPGQGPTSLSSLGIPGQGPTSSSSSAVPGQGPTSGVPGERRASSSHTSNFGQ